MYAGGLIDVDGIQEQESTGLVMFTKPPTRATQGYYWIFMLHLPFSYGRQFQIFHLSFTDIMHYYYQALTSMSNRCKTKTLF